MKYEDYINKNKFGQECLVVTTINAYMCLTGNVIKQNSKKYDNLVKLAGAEFGTAIHIEKVWRKLGIYPEISRSKYSLPMEISIQTKFGLHSVCAVEYLN